MIATSLDRQILDAFILLKTRIDTQRVIRLLILIDRVIGIANTAEYDSRRQAADDT